MISKFFSANFLAAPITGKSSINFSRYLRSFKKNLTINYLKFSFTSVKNKNAKIEIRETFLLSVLSWIFLASIAALPIYLSSLDLSYTDAFFEATSGITTAGSTILNNIENI